VHSFEHEAKQHGYLFWISSRNCRRSVQTPVRGLFTRGALPYYSRESEIGMSRKHLYPKAEGHAEMEKLVRPAMSSAYEKS